MEIALISDQHFGVNNFCSAQHKSFAFFYDQIFFPALEKRRIKTVIDLGDTFDRSAVPDEHLISWAKRNYFDRLLNLGIQLVVLRGNHNPKKSGNGRLIDAITSIGNEYSNINLVDSPKYLTLDSKNILLSPYIDHKLGLKKSSMNHKKSFDQYFSRFSDSRVDLIMTHLAFSEHKVFENKNTTGGFSPKMQYLKNLRTPIISGHYHPRSSRTSPSISYLGAPYALKRSEFNVKRGFHFLDTDSLKLEYLENTFQVFNYKLVDSIDSYFDSLADLTEIPPEYLYIIPNLSINSANSSINHLDHQTSFNYVEFIDTTNKLQSFIQVLISRKEYLIARKILEHSLNGVTKNLNLCLQYVFVLMGINTPESNQKAIKLFNKVISIDAKARNKDTSGVCNSDLLALIQSLSTTLHENSFS